MLYDSESLGCVMYEIKKRHKVDLLKVKLYYKVLRLIPEHNAIVRYKPGNMGHKIAMYELIGQDKHAIMNYLDANEDNLLQKVNDYLGF